jgi:hypothetical protein
MDSRELHLLYFNLLHEFNAEIAVLSSGLLWLGVSSPAPPSECGSSASTWKFWRCFGIRPYRVAETFLFKPENWCRDDDCVFYLKLNVEVRVKNSIEWYWTIQEKTIWSKIINCANTDIQNRILNAWAYSGSYTEYTFHHHLKMGMLFSSLKWFRSDCYHVSLFG